ncbi:tetratricopeptide repeat protein [Candidatus Obscuribacterales bacterium]|nr:tetratricopeptide repeat protein [Candidatus Obscuribacterales bacterium]
MKNNHTFWLPLVATTAILIGTTYTSTASAQPLRKPLPGYSVIGDSTKTDAKADGPKISAPSANGYSSNGASWHGQSQNQGASRGGGANNNVRSRNTAAPGAAALSSLKPGQLKKLTADALRYEKEGLAEEKKGNLNGALLKLKQSLNMREYYWGQRDRAVPVLLERIAAVQAKQKKYSDAIASTEKALSYYSKIYGPGTTDRIPALLLLGRLFQENSEFEKSFEQYKQALELTERSRGSKSSEAAKLRLILARQSDKLNWDRTTDEYYKGCLEADASILGASEYTKAGEEYAAFLTKLGRVDDAKLILEKAHQSSVSSTPSSSAAETKTQESSSSSSSSESTRSSNSDQSAPTATADPLAPSGSVPAAK